MWPRIDGMRAFGLATPGPLRDELNALVLAGRKEATAGLWRVDYEPEGEAVDEVGERQVLLDGDGAPLAVVEVTRVEVHRFVDVPWTFAEAEGEGFVDIEDWRAGHRDFYRDQGVEVGDDDRTVCAWFRLVQVLGDT